VKSANFSWPTTLEMIMPEGARVPASHLKPLTLQWTVRLGEITNRSRQTQLGYEVLQGPNKRKHGEFYQLCLPDAGMA